MAYGDFKDLKRRTFSDKVLRDKAFNIAKILNMMDIKEDLLLWFIKFLIKSRQVAVVLCPLLRKLLIMILNKIFN